MKQLLFIALVFVGSCTNSPKAGLIRSDSGYILATNIPHSPRLIKAKWNVMGIRKFKDNTSVNASIVIDSVVVAVQLGDTLRDKAGKPIYDSVSKSYKADTSWSTNGLSFLTLSYLTFRLNPQP